MTDLFWIGLICGYWLGFGSFGIEPEFYEGSVPRWGLLLLAFIQFLLFVCMVLWSIGLLVYFVVERG